MRMANVENSTLNWVSISSAAALDMTHCDFRQVARGRNSVHELTSEVSSRLKCVMKIIAMLVHVWIGAACDEGGPGFVKASVRTVTNARQVGMRMRSKCTGTRPHARVDASNTTERRNKQERGYVKLPEPWRSS